MHTINTIAEQYVKLTLAIGHYSQYYVDAYYGPEHLKSTAKIPLATLAQQATELATTLRELPIGNNLARRQQYLLSHIQAAHCYIQQLQQQPITFIEECQGLYDVTPPTLELAHFDSILTELHNLLPGNASLNQRLNDFKQQFIVPTNKLDKVFSTAIFEARERTLKHIELPKHENFIVKQTNNQVWSAYNWYKGNAYSLIEINTDHPIFIDRVIDLAAHEGYPGHHVFNALLEQHLVNQKGWLEYSIYPLFSPSSLLAEGSANYGIEVAFPWQERLEFEKQQLFKLAGLDSDKAEQYYQIQNVLQQMSYIDNTVAQQYLDGHINQNQAVELLMTYALSAKPRAEQRLKFIEANRSYVINYNYGQDLVKDYLTAQLQNHKDLTLWQAFSQLLSEPLTGSMMQKIIR